MPLIAKVGSAWLVSVFFCGWTSAFPWTRLQYFLVFDLLFSSCHFPPRFLTIFTPSSSFLPHKYHSAVLKLRLKFPPPLNPASERCYCLLWTLDSTGLLQLDGVVWRLLWHAKTQSPLSRYIPPSLDDDRANSVIKVDSFQPQHHTSNATWLDMGASYSESAASCLPWYASPTESDGPRTSDLSPVSGYFDWSHSSNNTSPMQYDESICQSSRSARSAVHHPLHIARPELQSPFLGEYPLDRRSSCQETTSLMNFQQAHSFVTNYPHPQEIAPSEERSVSTIPIDAASPSCKLEPSSISTTDEIADNEESTNSRSGKRWKAAHRAVERRYRSNLNLKIVKLGQCIPAIRSQVAGIDDLEHAEDCRTTTKSKLQKGHVLSKAVDYIQSLQQLVSELEADKKQLENTIESLHMMVGEDNQASSDINQFGLASDVSRRVSEQVSEPQIMLERRPKDEMSVMLKNEEGTESLSPHARYAISPRQNGFSFVSENPSFTSKRPKVVRTGFSRLPPG